MMMDDDDDDDDNRDEDRYHQVTIKLRTASKG
jgi:hypothetical protein